MRDMGRYEMGIYGHMTPLPDVTGMMYPVQCAYCPGVYDLTKVEVTARYTDCSMWKSPCCKRTVDDRGETGWKSTKDYHRLDADGRRQR